MTEYPTHGEGTIHDKTFRPMTGEEWKSGAGPSVQIGYVNRNSQRCCGHRGAPGTDHGQYAYKVECTKCGNMYGAN